MISGSYLPSNKLKKKKGKEKRIGLGTKEEHEESVENEVVRWFVLGENTYIETIERDTRGLVGGNHQHRCRAFRYLRTRNRETSGRECWSDRGRVEIYEKRSSIGSSGVKRKSLLLDGVGRGRDKLGEKGGGKEGVGSRWEE